MRAGPQLHLVVFVALAAVAGRAWAQEGAAPPTVRSVTVERAEEIPEADAALSVFGVEPGDPYDPGAVRLGVRRVYLTGAWTDVRVYRIARPDGVALVLALTPDVVIDDVEVQTTGTIPPARLQEQLGLVAGERFRQRRIEEVRQGLVEACKSLGYPAAAVEAVVEPAAANRTRVVFRVVEGTPTILRHVTIEGAPQLARADVLQALGLREGAPFDRITFDEGRARLLDRYHGQRRLLARVALRDTRFVDDGQGVEVAVEVDAGPRYGVDVSGNRVVPGAYLRDRIQPRKVGALDAAARERLVKKILSYYRESGFARAKVTLHDVPAYPPYDRTSERLLLFVIDEGPRATLSEIVIEGAVSKKTAALTENIWEYVRAETPGGGLFQRVDLGDVEELLGAEAGRREERPVELSDVGLGLFPTPGVTKEPVYLEPLFREAGERIADLYRADGFLQVRVEGPEPVFLGQGEKVRVRYRVFEGPQVLVSGVRITPTPTLPVAELLSVASFVPGDPANLYAVEETRLALLRLLKERGFPFAQVVEDLVGDPASGRVEVVYRLDEGPRVRVGKVRVRGNETTRDFVIVDRLALVEGDWYAQSQVAASRRRLLSMGLFSSVSIDLLDDRPDATVRDVVVTVRERRQYAFETGLGASVEDGPRVFLAGEARNILGLALGVRARAQVNYPFFTYDFVYQEDDPNNPKYRFDDQPLWLRWLFFFEGQAVMTAELPQLYGVPFDTRLHIDAVGLREIRPSFTLIRGSVLGGVDVQPFSWWKASLELEAEASDFDCPRDLEFGQSCGQTSIGLTRRRDAGFIRQMTHRISTSLDFRDDPFRPHFGAFFAGSVDAAVGSGVLRANAEAIEPERVNADFLKVSGIASAYLPLADEFTFAATLRAGNIFPVISDNNYIPLYKRFYLGGTNSIRGFFEDEILPADHPRWPADQVQPDPGFGDLVGARNSLGGNFVVNARSELRIALVGDLESAIFFDGGQLLSDVRNLNLGSFAAGAGVGLRYLTPVGPFAVDLGWRVLDGRRQLAPLVSLDRMNVHFSIGYF